MMRMLLAGVKGIHVWLRSKPIFWMLMNGSIFSNAVSISNRLLLINFLSIFVLHLILHVPISDNILNLFISLIIEIFLISVDLHHRFEDIWNFNVAIFSVLFNGTFNIRKCDLLGLFLLLVEINKPDFWFRGVVCVDSDHFYNFIHHQFLHFFLCLVLELNLLLGRIISAQISVQPYPNFPTFINCHLLLRNRESTTLLKQFLITLQHGPQTIQVIRVRDVLEVTESGFGVLDVDFGRVSS
jgi:hypothetical protein